MEAKLKNKKHDRGIAALMTAIALSAFALMATTELTYRSVQENTKLDQYAQMRAEHLSAAGLEYALKTLKTDGTSPVVTGKTLNGGTFDIVTDPDKKTVISTGHFGDAVVAHSVQTPFAKDCLKWNLSNAHSVGDKLIDVKWDAICNPMPTVIIDKLKVQWNIDVGDKIIQYFITGQGVPGPEYDAAVDNPIGGAVNDTIIDHKDYTPSLNGPGVIPINQIQFNTNPILGARTYTMTAYYKDGSSITDTFVDPTPVVAPTPIFTIPKQGEIEVTANKLFKLDILGSAITCGASGPEIYVKAWYKKKPATGGWSNYITLWGGADLDGGETFQTTPTESTTYSFKANAWKSGCYNQSYLSTQSAQVKTLVNGDQAPALAGFGGQKPVLAFLQPYLNASGKLVLASNQVILLWELGVNMTYNANSPAADFQDLVMLVTIGP
ncbi:MAG: hypothetical protein HYU97_12175 [Deltaproteobacteria bacterium]|nr:hypothetical protein [Deltaproteobacteria bacterium]